MKPRASSIRSAQYQPNNRFMPIIRLSAKEQKTKCLCSVACTWNTNRVTTTMRKPNPLVYLCPNEHSDIRIRIILFGIGSTFRKKNRCERSRNETLYSNSNARNTRVRMFETFAFERSTATKSAIQQSVFPASSIPQANNLPSNQKIARPHRAVRDRMFFFFLWKLPTAFIV